MASFGISGLAADFLRVPYRLRLLSVKEHTTPHY